VRRLFHLICALRRGEAPTFPAGVSGEAIDEHPQLASAKAAAEELGSLHFPVGFPEVFLRDRPGFDCLVGNPPWEKLQVEEHSYYALHFPGLRGVSQARAEQTLPALRQERPDLVAAYEGETKLVQRMKTALAKGPYPGLTAGRPDLFKAFAWRAGSCSAMAGASESCCPARRWKQAAPRTGDARSSKRAFSAM
jgi:hypothetical protein